MSAPQECPHLPEADKAGLKINKTPLLQLQIPLENYPCPVHALLLLINSHGTAPGTSYSSSGTCADCQHTVSASRRY